MKKRIFPLLLTLCLLGALSGCGAEEARERTAPLVNTEIEPNDPDLSSASYMYSLESVSDLLDVADIIIVGKLLEGGSSYSTEDTQLQMNGDTYTVSGVSYAVLNYEVTQVLRGDTSLVGETITLNECLWWSELDNESVARQLGVGTQQLVFIDIYKGRMELPIACRSIHLVNEFDEITYSLAIDEIEDFPDLKDIKSEIKKRK